MAGEEPKTKKFKRSVITNRIYSSTFEEDFSKYWHGFLENESEYLTFVPKPFRVCKISNFLENKFVVQLKKQLLYVKHIRHDTDLYQYNRSNDLTNIKGNNIEMLHQALKTDMTSWMQRNTGIILNGHVSMSSSRYYDTDYLLCHDDNMDDRRIAFILYLSKKWLVEDGGTLDLFDTDEDGLPKNVVKSLVPEYNSLVFFEVVDNSYHQVAEILSSKCRFSINGWFHGTIQSFDRSPRTIEMPNFIGPSNVEVDAYSWFNSVYLCADIVKTIQTHFESKSYILIQNFLARKTYEGLMADLISQDIRWEMVGPADVRRYEIADKDSLPGLLKDFYNIFKSISVFRLFKNFTDLDLVPNNEDMNPKVVIELQRWSAGCYTLMYDRLLQVDDMNCSNGNESVTLVNQNAQEDMTVPKEKRATIPECSPMPSVSNSDKINVLSGSEGYPSVKEDTKDTNTSKLINKSTKKHRAHQREEALLGPSTSFGTSETSSSSRIASCSNDSSDNEDYSLDSASPENPYREDGSSSDTDGILETMIQFHTCNLSVERTIDYVDPTISDGTIIQVPIKDNYLCLVYKQSNISRVHKYINHHCKGYFYNMLCTYYE